MTGKAIVGAFTLQRSYQVVVDAKDAAIDFSISAGKQTDKGQSKEESLAWIALASRRSKATQ